MSESNVKFHGFIGSALIGVDPFDPRSWSGISRFLFRECERQGILHGASGGEVGGLTRLLLLTGSFHPRREIWRLRFYLSSRYRHALTRVLQPQAAALPEGVDVLQLGGLFDLPSVVQGQRRCFSYHDGNMAMRLKNPYASTAVPERLASAAMRYERQLYHKLTRVFTMSEHLRHSFIKDFGLAPERVVCVGAGVNLERMPPAKPDKRHDTGEILFIGVDFERKGGLVLLEAFDQVRRKHPAATLHVVGPRGGPPAGVPLAGVEWHGHLNKQYSADAEKLEHLFDSSSLFVLPSLYEPFGIAPAEAMTYSLPAVVSGAWALGETVLDGQTGLHATPGDTSSLVKALLYLLDHPEETAVMGQAARQRALEHFTWDRVVQRMTQEMQP